MTTTQHKPDRVQVAIERADKRLNAKAGYNANDISGLHEVLMKRGRVEVGWRESCGTTDPTHRIYREWLKLVKAMARDGITLKEERQKHGNSYATKKGGFWNSIIYSLAESPATPS